MVLERMIIFHLCSLYNKTSFCILVTAAVLYSAEGPVRGGREGQDSLTASTLLGESKQPPEGKGEDH